ncbi:MAG: hypothetical protein ABMB14_27175, partial [Myxococcota bacterium]
DEPPPADDGDDKDDGLDTFRDDEAGDDLLGDEPVGPGSGDSETIYRAVNTRLSKLDPDEELAGWEEYLAKYPNSAFRRRIEARMEELTDAIYEGPKVPEGGGPVDAMDQELHFSQALQLENIDPRTRLQVGGEWGYLDYLSPTLDYEHQLARTFSIHGGLHGRYLGVNVEAGARWALVKSVRTGMLLTAIGDFRMNINPAYPGFRPQLAIGKRFGKLDAQLQGGVDIEFRPSTAPAGLGGLALYYAASERVGLFAETRLYVRPLPADGAFAGGAFQFNVADFGMKFFPGNSPERNIEVNLGATVPYMQNWWQFHYGSVMVQLNYYL